MNNCAFDLCLPCDFINSDFNHRLIKQRHSKVEIIKCLSQEVIIFFQSLNLKATSAELFIKQPAPEYDLIHIDDFDCPDRARFNYVIEDQNSVMGFFRPLSKNCGYLANGQTGGKPRRYRFTEVELIYQHKIKTPSIIQTAIPHAVLNPYGVRYSLAVNLYNTNTDTKLSFNDAKKIFREYITE